MDAGVTATTQRGCARYSTRHSLHKANVTGISLGPRARGRQRTRHAIQPGPDRARTCSLLGASGHLGLDSAPGSVCGHGRCLSKPQLARPSKLHVPRACDNWVNWGIFLGPPQILHPEASHHGSCHCHWAQGPWARILMASSLPLSAPLKRPMLPTPVYDTCSVPASAPPTPGTSASSHLLFMAPGTVQKA